MRSFLLLLLIPCALMAQNLQFQLNPGAFQAEIDGQVMQQAWAGGMNGTTPKLVDINNNNILDLFTSNESGYIAYFQNLGFFAILNG